MSFDPGKQSFEGYPERLQIEADVCVIGAGAGGCAAALALAEAGLTVAVLEEGRHWRTRDFKPHAPSALRDLYQEAGARAAFGKGMLLVNGGRGVGGSTLINSGICFRIPDVVLSDWRDNYGCEGLEPTRYRALEDRVWSTIGAIKNPPSVQRANNLVFKRGVESLGLNGDFMYRSAPGCVGCGLCQLGCPSGGKLSADRSFLGLALNTGRVAAYADCRVDRALVEGGRLVGLTGRTMDPVTYAPAGEVEVRADRFLLAAGPIGSPRFLLRNGLATSEHCGAHLHFHPALGMAGHFDEVINPWEGVTQGYYVDRWDEGYLLQTFSVTPDQLFSIMPLPIGDLEVMADMRRLALAGVLVHDEDSIGRVTDMTIQYEFGDLDRTRLLKGMRACSEVFFAAGAHTVYPSIAGGQAIRSPSEIDEKIPLETSPWDLMAVSSHPMGTCRMGDDPSRSVLDPRGRVWGWENLFVADASVFPTSLGVNPQVTVMTMGLLIAQELAQS